MVISVTDEDGVAIEGATVTLVDKDDNEVFSVETDANGDIACQTVNHSYATYATGTAWNLYGPFTMTISKAGTTYLTQVHKLDLDSKTKEQISMTDVADIIEDLDDIKGTGFAKDTHSLTNVISDVSDVDTNITELKVRVDDLETENP